jgi:hypothetical protein
MKLFACDYCQQTLYFENSRCLGCGATVGYCPETGRLAALPMSVAPVSEFEIEMPDNAPRRYRPCRNFREYEACNWLVAADDRDDYCRSCRLSIVIPDLSYIANERAWHRIEAAKRRLLYSLFALRLPVDGLTFRFLKGTEDEPVITRHEEGVITLNIDEADFTFRENMREKMGEAYRTVLGHLRHESGHFYWDRLVRDSDRLDRFRDMFGDERASYEEALERHYEFGPPLGWGASFVSAYASMHPWEDWAETWAHYLHTLDTLETAKSHGLTVRTPAADRLGERVATDRLAFFDFESLSTGWAAVTLALNSLNRSMGREDAYPFVLSQRVLDKLRFVHEIVQEQRAAAPRIEAAA